VTDVWRSHAAASPWRAAAFDLGLLPFVRRRDAFEPAYVERVAEDVLASPYLAESNLNYRFSGTRGFSVIFRDAALQRVKDEFPAFVPYLDAVIDPRCNAFFLNPLVVADGARVAPHIDRSLRSVTLPAEPPNPRKVSVLYARVPSGMKGGCLVLYHRLFPLARLAPRPNVLVEFQGFLRHEVTAVSGVVEPRVSLVCEQYLLDASLLLRVPEYTVRSMQDFESFYRAELEHLDAVPDMVEAEPLSDEDWELASAALEAESDVTAAPAQEGTDPEAREPAADSIPDSEDPHDAHPPRPQP